MSYLDDVEKDLRDILDTSAEPEAQKRTDEIVKFVREKLLESYKNGAQAARKQMGKTPTLKQKSQTGNHSKA